MVIIMVVVIVIVVLLCQIKEVEKYHPANESTGPPLRRHRNDMTMGSIKLTHERPVMMYSIM